MTDETTKTAFDERAEVIREAMVKIAHGIEASLHGKREPTIEETTEALSGVLTLAHVTILAINEIANNVGRLADAAERDLNAEVDKVAEARANDKVAGKIKRSFIGMKNTP